MSIFVESLKRLFYTGKVDVEKLNNLKTTGKISEDEYNYIVEQNA